MVKMEGTPQQTPDTFESLEAEWQAASARNNSIHPSEEELEIARRWRTLADQDPFGLEEFARKSSQNSGSGNHYRGGWSL